MSKRIWLLLTMMSCLPATAGCAIDSRAPPPACGLVDSGRGPDAGHGGNSEINGCNAPPAIGIPGGSFPSGGGNGLAGAVSVGEGGPSGGDGGSLAGIGGSGGLATGAGGFDFGAGGAGSLLGVGGFALGAGG
jgi:hypothetical protein